VVATRVVADDASRQYDVQGKSKTFCEVSDRSNFADFEAVMCV
jgi:hypothetical protein